MDCGEDCPVDASSSSIDTRAIKSSIAEIDLSWAEHKGYSTKSQSGVKEAAFSAADFVVTQPAGM